MHSHDMNSLQRRKVLTLLGISAVALPVLGLSGCGGDDTTEDSSPAEMGGSADPMKSAAKEPAAQSRTTAESVMSDAESAMDSAEATMKETMESGESAAKDAMDKAKTIATDTAGGLSKVDENSAQALQLGYRHDATTVDKAKQPRYAAGQNCSNCAIYQGGDAAWGGCPLFAGKQVKATGWCNAYVKAG